MISRTRSAVGSGDDTATFHLVLPRGRALSDSCGPLVGKPIGFYARYASSEIDYKMTLTVRYSGSGTISSDYKDAFRPAGDKSTAETITTFGAKLAVHNRKDGGQVPPGVLELLPELALEPVSEKQKAFRLRLPPYTAMISDRKGFFETLGFDPRLVETVRKDDGDEEHGLWNWTGSTTLALSSSWFGPELMSNGWLMFAANPKESSRIRVTRALLDHSVSAVSDGRQPALQNTAMGVLSGMLEILLAQSGLPDDTLTLDVGDDDEMVIANKETNGSLVTLELVLDPETARFLQVGVPTLTFPLFDRRSYVLQPRDSSADPLEKHYPLSLVPLGFGSAVNYIQGMGHVPLLAHLDGPGDLHGPLHTFQLSEQFLSLRFVDRHLRILRFKEPVELFLTLELHPLSS